MKKEILEKLNRMFDDSGRDGCYYGDTAYDSLPVVYGYNLAIADAIKDIESIPEPEPLDPHMCELCVGDVVKDRTDGHKIVVYKIWNPENYICNIHGFNINMHLPCSYERHDVILTQRAGMQIGE